MRTLVAVVALLVASCSPKGPVPFPIDASDAAPLPAGQMACAHLRELGCPLGSDSNCAAAFSLPSKFRADPTCVLAAKAAADLSACNVTCQP